MGCGCVRDSRDSPQRAPGRGVLAGLLAKLTATMPRLLCCPNTPRRLLRAQSSISSVYSSPEIVCGRRDKSVVCGHRESRPGPPRRCPMGFTALTDRNACHENRIPWFNASTASNLHAKILRGGRDKAFWVWAARNAAANSWPDSPRRCPSALQPLKRLKRLQYPECTHLSHLILTRRSLERIRAPGRTRSGDAPSALRSLNRLQHLVPIPLESIS
ncbi:hypothetical protein BDV95DRAFT_396720 [Massariosphaeria phaeospora]|uniref:Uncharacterized protein n=1 Tax=Massariosphaeria phaeospora TaxID=100035 RepID=A0A7C8MQU2_9PLEO|nr:hypothetical protein BDV95DRAFT_396720 [Massariosphaeria phaeospora]